MTNPYIMDNNDQNLEESCGKYGLDFADCSCCEVCEDQGIPRDNGRRLCQECFDFKMSKMIACLVQAFTIHACIAIPSFQFAVIKTQ